MALRASVQLLLQLTALPPLLLLLLLPTNVFLKDAKTID